MALFNGMSLTAPEVVATILAYDDARAQPLLNAPASGYQRMEGGDAVVIVDTGPAPPQRFSTHAHASCLAFELSSGRQRIVVNCGTPEVNRASAREASRVTAAHSTLVIDDTSSCRFAGQSGLRRWLGDEILAGPVRVPVERTPGEDATVLTASHDGYAARFAALHRRELTLAGDGSRLEGCDALVAADERRFKLPRYALRFHLHPSVAAAVVGDGAAVLLDCPDGERWLFQADAPATLEPSVLFAAGGGPRPTLQIRVAQPDPTRLVTHWAFRKGPAASDPRLSPGSGR